MRVALIIIAAAGLALQAFARVDAPITAQTLTPTPQTVAIPGAVTVAPGTTVTFQRLSDQARLTVSYSSAPGPATLTYDGDTLTVRVPALGVFELVAGSGPEATCARLNDQHTALRCTVQPTAAGVRLGIGIIYGDPIYPFPSTPGSGLAAMPLAAGCTNVVLTFADGTPFTAVARSLIAPGSPIAARLNPEAVWKLDATSQRFLGWSPLPDAPSDFREVNRLDAVFLCVGEAGQLVQPAIP
jgi:hypothetical protein